MAQSRRSRGVVNSGSSGPPLPIRMPSNSPTAASFSASTGMIPSLGEEAGGGEAGAGSAGGAAGTDAGPAGGKAPPAGAAVQDPPVAAEQPGTPPVLQPALAGAAWGSGMPIP